jgi:hypothetical protein
MSQDYEFEVTITAVIRVRAESESLAREVVASSALASPTVVSVDFSVEEDSITSAAAREAVAPRRPRVRVYG